MSVNNFHNPPPEYDVTRPKKIFYMFYSKSKARHYPLSASVSYLNLFLPYSLYKDLRRLICRFVQNHSFQIIPGNSAGCIPAYKLLFPDMQKVFYLPLPDNKYSQDEAYESHFPSYRQYFEMH